MSPMYYDIVRETTTNGTTATRSPHLLFLTGTAVTCSIRGLYCSAAGSTAGGGTLFCETANTTAGSVGSALAAPTLKSPRNPSYPTAVTAITMDGGTAITSGSALVERAAVGWAATGGMGGWVALEPDAAILLRPAGGITGNAELSTKAVGTSVPVKITAEWAEI
jgi:hypothetical protein